MKFIRGDLKERTTVHVVDGVTGRVGVGSCYVDSSLVRERMDCLVEAFGGKRGDCC